MTVLAFQLSNETFMFWLLVIIAVCFAVMALSMVSIAYMVFRAVGVVIQFQQKAEPLIQAANNIGSQGKEIA
ncbi:MAG: hypothetical protein ABI954_12520, partial [Pyrinomonadaceae bacterium]